MTKLEEIWLCGGTGRWPDAKLDGFQTRFSFFEGLGKRTATRLTAMSLPNQQKNRQRRGPPKGRTPSAKQPYQLGLNRRAQLTTSKLSHLHRNGCEEIVKWANRAFDTPIQTMLGIISIVASVFGIIDFCGKRMGTSASVMDWSPLVSNFQMRVVLFTLIAASVAGSISTIGKLLTIGNNNLAINFAHIFTFLGAFFLAACTEWIFAIDFRHASPFAYAASIGGVAFAVFLAKTNFSYSYQQDNKIRTSRAGLLANFAISTSLAVIVIFVEVAK